MTSQQGPGYLKSSEAAAILQVSRETLGRWSREGLLPHRRTLGGQRRYDEQVVRELLAANTHPTGQEEPDG